MKTQAAPPQTPQPPPKAIAAALKHIIEDAYDTGITRVLTFDINDKGIVFGRFHDDDQVYDYEIQPNGAIRYNETEVSGRRSDSLLIGYYVDSGALLRESLQSRQDASPRRTGKPKCKNSKRCKGSCIARGFECDTKLSPLATTRFQGVRRAIAAMKGRQTPGAAGSASGSGENQKSTVQNTQNPKTGGKPKGKGGLAGAAALGVGALAAAGVAGAIAANQKPNSESAQQEEAPDKEAPFKRPSGTTVATIAAGATVLGVPAAAYAATVMRYRKNLDRSAMKAMEEAETYDVPDEIHGGMRFSEGEIKNTSDADAEQVTLMTNGFGGTNGKGGDHFGQQFNRLFEQHHVVAVENPEFDIANNKKGQIKQQFALMLKTIVAKGENRVAIRMAARAYAYHQKYPDKPVNLVGYSGGGMVANETAEILKRMGVKDVKVANIGSPHYGLVPNSALNFIASDDSIRKNPGFKNLPNNANLQDPVKGHTRYLTKRNKEVRRKLEEHFNRQTRKDVFDEVLDQRIKRLLTSAIASVFKDISTVKSFHGSLKTGNLMGRFEDKKGQVFTFTIRPDGGIGYQPATSLRTMRRQDVAQVDSEMSNRSHAQLDRKAQAKVSKVRQLLQTPIPNESAVGVCS